MHVYSKCKQEIAVLRLLVAERYETSQKLPWQAFEGASDMRLKLLGVKMPDRDIHMYDPSL